jgi:hypothetical protein
MTMGRKNRRKPFQCPVGGCLKRGLRADLVRHASVMHPNVTRDAYISALTRGVMLNGKPSRRLSLNPWKWGWASQAMSIGCILLTLALVWIANQG